MGIGLPFCVAVKAVHLDKFVVGILGDSAFGFSAMELGNYISYCKIGFF